MFTSKPSYQELENQKWHLETVVVSRRKPIAWGLHSLTCTDQGGHPWGLTGVGKQPTELFYLALQIFRLGLERMIEQTKVRFGMISPWIS